MPTVSKVLRHETWGRVIALIVDGVRTDRPEAGTTAWRPPPEDAGVIDIAHSECPESVLHLTLGVRQFPAIAIPNDDERVSPAWAALVAQLIAGGTDITELLADVAQPAPERLAQAKAAAATQARQHYDRVVAAGISIDLPTGAKRIAIGEESLNGYVRTLTVNASAPDSTTVVIDDIAGVPISVTLGTFRSKQAQVAQYFRDVRTAWSNAVASIMSCETVDEVIAARDQFTARFTE